jgi:thiol-disulfide isomerase/thioredoxin
MILAMKKLIIVLSLFFSISVADIQAQPFTAYKSWADARESARLAHKKILLYFGATWCAPCKRLKNEVFTDSSVRSLLEAKFICYEFDVDQENAIAFLKKYAINTYPLILILDEQGFLNASIQNFPEAISEFIVAINKAAASDSVFQGISNRLDLDYPKFYDDYYLDKQRKLPDPSTVTEYLKSQTDLFSEVNWNVLTLFNTDAELIDSLLSNEDKYVRLYGRSEVGMKLYYIRLLFFKKYVANKDSVGYNRFCMKFLAKESDSQYANSLRSYYLNQIKFLAYTGMDWNKFILVAKAHVQKFGHKDEFFIFNYLEYSPNKNVFLYRVLPYILHPESTHLLELVFGYL